MKYGLGLVGNQLPLHACVHLVNGWVKILKFVNSFGAFSLLQADIDGEVEKVLFKDGGLCFLAPDIFL